jgi:transposase
VIPVQSGHFSRVTFGQYKTNKMANKRTDMRKVRDLLRLKFEQGMSARAAAQSVGMGKSVASEYISGFSGCGLSLEQALALSDSELTGALNLRKQTTNVRYQQLSGQFAHYEKELKRTGVTLYLLWTEYHHQTPDGYGYSRFCFHFDQWQKGHKVSMHIEHKSGDKVFVDFAGSKLFVTDARTGVITEYEVFVAVLGASQYSYIEAVASQTKADWVQVNENALRFFKGVPLAIVPDCLKSAVIKADKYEPVINDTFRDFGQHYCTTILPARALHPKDKALAEGFVRMAYRRIYAPLRDRVFFSLEELNQALWEQLDKHNKMPFQGRDYSREQLYKEIEQAQLKPLPVAFYDLKEYTTAKVQYNHHIYLKPDKHYYSVPFQLTGKKVFVSYSNRFIEIYYDNQRVATHSRSLEVNGYTTNDLHRPASHLYVSEWSPKRFIQWGQKIGPNAGQVIEQVLQSKSHPEQAYRSCMGILSLSKKHPQEDFLKACNKAIETGCYTYRFICNTLKNKTFNLAPEEELKQIHIPFHENIRGKEWYN